MSFYNDWVLGNWYVSTLPNSLFTSNAVLALVTPTGRISVFNGDYTERQLVTPPTNLFDQEEMLGPVRGYKTVKKTCGTDREFLEILDSFNIKLPRKHSVKLPQGSTSGSATITTMTTQKKTTWLSWSLQLVAATAMGMMMRHFHKTLASFFEASQSYWASLLLVPNRNLAPHTIPDHIPEFLHFLFKRPFGY